MKSFAQLTIVFTMNMVQLCGSEGEEVFVPSFKGIAFIIHVFVLQESG